MIRINSFERLETRCLLSATTVTDDAIITAHDAIPRMIGADVIAINSGRWSDPATWGGGVPGPGDNVRILDGIDVLFDQSSEIANLEIFGALRFAPEQATSLKVVTIHVMPSGELQIGSDQTPISASAEIVFADVPIDTQWDPFQFSNGLLVFGSLETNGRDVTPYVRAAADINAGDRVIRLTEVPADWRVGDEVLLPGTEQRTKGDQDLTTETGIISAIGENEIVLVSPATLDHHGISENPFGIDVYAHIGNLTRNVVLRSENPEGTRGHFLSTGHAAVDIKDAAVLSMGRTTGEHLDNTTVDDDGRVIHVGTNHIARYPIHAHHNHGQFDVKSSVIEDGLKWAITIHATDDANIVDNIVYDVDGGGIVTEDGSEERNQFIGNLVVQVNGGFSVGSRGGGGGAKRFGADGSGFWFRLASGTVEDNVVYDARGYGYNANGYGISFTANRGTFDAFDSFKGNEVASSRGGVWLTWSQGQTRFRNFARTVIEDTLVWHIRQDGVHSYHEANYTFKNFTVIGDPESSNRNGGSRTKFQHRTTTGISQTRTSYENWNMVYDGLYISGVNTAVALPGNPGEEGTIVRNAYLSAYVNLAIAENAPTDKLLLENINFLPSQVIKVARAFPDVVANVWQEAPDGGIVLEPGVLDRNVDPVLPPESTDSSVRLVNGVLNVDGSSANDTITIDIVGNELVVGLNGELFQFARENVKVIAAKGRAGNDSITNNVDDVIVRLYGGEGDDTLIGGNGVDKLSGGPGDDFIDGRGGDDTIWGLLGDDTLLGGLGVDKIRGSGGDDLIFHDDDDSLVTQ